MKYMRSALAALGIMVATAAPTAAQEAHFVVPYAAGGPMDQIARVLAPAIQEQLGRTVIVENVAGAGGMIGTNQVKSAKPDGLTFSLSSQGSHVLTSLTQAENLPYDPFEDFTAIALVGRLPNVLAARPSLEADTLDELVELAKQKRLTFGSSGVGNSPHLAGEMLNNVAGIKMTHIPYGGVGPVIVDILAGNVDMVVADMPVVTSQVAAGEMKAIAVFAEERSPAMPDVPTSVEQGYPDLLVGNYYFIMAPKGLPEDVRANLEKAIIAAASDPAVAEKLAAAGLGQPQDGKFLTGMLHEEFDKWRPYVENLELADK